MIRVEFILNQSIEEDFLDLIKKAVENEIIDQFYYTKIENTHGKGSKGEKRGDSIWPEVNVIYIVYTEDNFIDKIKNELLELKEKFRDEGFKVYISYNIKKEI